MKTRDFTVIVGGTGKTGRRVSERLAERHIPHRAASRSGTPAFDWDDPSTWDRHLADAERVYLTFYPDLASPGAAPAIRRFTARAAALGVQKLVLLSGRGEPECHPSEDAVRESGLGFTILRSAFFCQNFSESLWLEPVLKGELAFLAGSVAEPFVDADDLAEVAVAALTDDRHAGQTYELTGPRPLTFAEAVREISEATGRTIRYSPVSKEAYAAILRQDLPPDVAAFLCDLFESVLDGHNAHVSGDVERVLGRPPRDFREWARVTAKSGVWSA